MNKGKNTRNKYATHKGGAKKRGIPFDLSFDEWCDIWDKSGKWELRGSRNGQYNMCRNFDKGGYDKDNVYIALASDNRKHYQQCNKYLLNSDDMEDPRREYQKKRGETNPYYAISKDEKPFMPRFDP